MTVSWAHSGCALEYLVHHQPSGLFATVKHTDLGLIPLHFSFQFKRCPQTNPVPLSVQKLWSADKPSSPFKSKVDLLTHLSLNLLQFSFRFKSCILKTLTPNPSLHQRDINEARGPAWPTSFHILLYSPDFARKMSTSVCVCTRVCVCVCVSVVHVFVFPYNTLCKLFR